MILRINKLLFFVPFLLAFSYGEEKQIERAIITQFELEEKAKQIEKNIYNSIGNNKTIIGLASVTIAALDMMRHRGFITSINQQQIKLGMDEISLSKIKSIENMEHTFGYIYYTSTIYTQLTYTY